MMSPRKYVLIAVAALAAAPAALASDAADRSCTRDRMVRAAVFTPRLALVEAFAKPQQDLVEDGMTAPMGPLEVIVARIGKDGKPVMSCVDTPEAAERFFKAAEERRQPRKLEAAEQ
jgi:hypothetical protein